MIPDTQLTLGLKLDAGIGFDNFFVAETNVTAVEHIKAQAVGDGEQFLFLHGALGLSHLLQASCNLAEASARAALYLPLAELVDYPAEEVLTGVEFVQLLCLDDVSAITAKPDWEFALFKLYNRALETGVKILIADRQPVNELCIQLPDLASRLQNFSVFRLAELTEREKKKGLQFCAQLRGLVINEQVSDYLLKRCDRSFQNLLEVLERLDQLSFQKKRAVTVALARELLDR